MRGYLSSSSWRPCWSSSQSQSCAVGPAPASDYSCPLQHWSSGLPYWGPSSYPSRILKISAVWIVSITEISTSVYSMLKNETKHPENLKKIWNWATSTTGCYAVFMWPGDMVGKLTHTTTTTSNENSRKLHRTETIYPEHIVSACKDQ